MSNLYHNDAWGLLPYLHHYNNLFFNKALERVVKNVLVTTSSFLENNLTKSLQFWNIKLSSQLLDGRLPAKHLVPFTSTYTYNQYYLPITVSNINTKTKHYRLVMLRFLIFTLSWNQQLNKHYLPRLHFLLNVHNFHLLRFYNTYFFKIYNL